jgi:octaheme c-type cytochrome (tetrathionate reductase family)
MRPIRPLLILLFAAGAAFAADPDSPPTADHTKFESLKGPFSDAREVTKACLDCHTEAAQQVMESIHWTWDFANPETGQRLGKRRVINAFCGNVASNEPRCTSCHAGYGWEDEATFDFTAETNVDCLVCHDTTGQYVKWPTKAGHPLYEPLTAAAGMVYHESLVEPAEGGKATYLPPDLSEVARHVGDPGRQNCGACHFFGGGGDNVKHGDLSTALIRPDPHTDVHMSPEGANMVCTDCHTAHGHKWPGSRYAGSVQDATKPKPGFRSDVLACDSCHGDRPHPTTIEGVKLNDHTDRVACQTCHIPTFAKGGVATKTWWDWSTAGQLKDGKPYHEEDAEGRHTYLSTKGDFRWGEEVEPTYAWWDGAVRYSLLGDAIDPSGVVSVNRVEGAPGDPDSRIYPFKRMEGRQAYDVVNRNLVYTNVFGPTTDTAFWTNFDWSRAIARGMEGSGVPYSGEFDFVDTEMWWPTTHMVAPADEALACADCHAKDGRLAGLTGFYLPGRDGFGMADRIGLGAVLAALGVVAAHAALRIIMAARRRMGS